MSTPELVQPPVYAVAAGAVVHAHSGSTAEPAVLLWTFLPAGGGDRLDDLDAKVDVHGNGPGSDTLTVRVLSEGQSLSWELPVAPFVAALPGQPGDDGRMVLLGVLDSEPDPGFWSQPVDCERLAAELQLPLSELADALRGRLAPWLVDDVELLLHDDAHEHAADQSPAQTLALAVHAHYTQELEAEQTTGRLLRAFDYAPTDYRGELGVRLCEALMTALAVAGPELTAQVVEEASPFEPEIARLLTDLPLALETATGSPVDAAVDVLLGGETAHPDAVRAAVQSIARLALGAFGPGLEAEELYMRLGMVSDAGQARLAGLWLDLAVAAGGPAGADAGVCSDLSERVAAEGPAGARWLRSTAALLSSVARDSGGRAKMAATLTALQPLVDTAPPPGNGISAPAAAGSLRSCLVLARQLRQRYGVGPGAWRAVPVESAAQAIGTALARSMSRDLAVDLFDELLESDVEGEDVLDAFVCATASALVELEPAEPAEQVQERLQAVLGSSDSSAKAARWLLVALLQRAPEHDPASSDLRALLGGEPEVDADKLAHKAGRRGVLTAGLRSLDTLTEVLGDNLAMPREELLAMVLPGAMVEHSLLGSAEE